MGIAMIGGAVAAATAASMSRVGGGRCPVKDCQCPCHQISWADRHFGIIFIASVLVGASIFGFAVCTLFGWVEDGKTLWQATVDNWHFVVSLMHRIY